MNFSVNSLTFRKCVKWIEKVLEKFKVDDMAGGGGVGKICLEHITFNLSMICKYKILYVFNFYT